MYDIPLSDWLSGSVHNMSLRFLGYSLSLEKGMVIHLIFIILDVMFVIGYQIKA